MKQLKPYYGWIAMCILLALIGSVAYVLPPFFIGKAIDAMNPGMFDSQQIFNFLMLCLSAYALYFVATTITQLIANHIAITYIESLRTELMDHLLKIPFSFLDKSTKGSLNNLFVMDGEMVIDAINLALNQFFNGIFVLVIAGFMMIRISFMMTLVVFIMIPIVYFSSKKIGKKSSLYFRQQQDHMATLNGLTRELLSNYDLILTSNYQNEASKSFNVVREKIDAVGVKAQFLSALTNPTTRFLNNLVYVALGFAGAYFMLKGNLTLGMFTSFLTYATMFSKPFNEMSGIFSQLIAGHTAYQRIIEALSVKTIENPSAMPQLKGQSIIFEDISFGYDEGFEVIKELSMEIAPLSKVAIVGPTGSGKSTLINLLMRFYEPNSGEISIDGYPYQTINRDATRQVMSIVLQEPWLFEGTIHENIAYGNPDATQDQVCDAARQAGCYDMIMATDSGFETVISGNATNISVGFRQLITIARALIANTPIFILDEATSNVDVVTEKHIQHVFQEIMKTHTTFFVAHRLTTVVDSDLILVMKDGSLVEHGTHAELMAHKGFYFELYQSQF